VPGRHPSITKANAGWTGATGARARTEQAREETEGLNPFTLAHELIDLYVGDQPVPYLEWALRVPEPKTGTLDFDRFPFQMDMYRAMGDQRIRDVVVRKATQVGVSAMTVRWALYEADRNGLTILYVFPTEKHVHDFSDARVLPMIDSSDYLAARAGDPQNKGLRRIGIGLCYFRGAENKRGLDSVDADGLALDEYDTLNQANIPDAERRLSGPMSRGLIRRVGVPSLPQFGIAEKYDESDRRKWLVRCELCRLAADDTETGEPLRTPPGKGWQEVDFWRNLDQARAVIVCAGCGGALDVRRGRWVAQNPDAPGVGFHVPRLIVPGIRLEDVIASSRKTNPYEKEVFYNKDLALPWVAKEARLSPDEVAAAVREDVVMATGYAGMNPVTMGVDVASERALNVRISELLGDDLKRALWIGEVDSFDELALLMDRFQVSMAVIDHLPETRMARGVAERFAGRVFLCSYATQGQLDVIKIDDEQRRVSVRRVEAIDHVVDGIRRQRNYLPVDLPEGYAAHLTAVVRRVERDELNRVTVRWVATRPDDYMQAEVYDGVAGAVWWIRQQVEEAQREVYTRLEDHLEFARSGVTDPDDVAYRPGPVEEDSIYAGASMYGLEDDRAY
jgi:hypothetical protein